MKNLVWLFCSFAILASVPAHAKRWQIMCQVNGDGFFDMMMSDLSDNTLKGVKYTFKLTSDQKDPGQAFLTIIDNKTNNEVASMSSAVSSPDVTQINLPFLEQGLSARCWHRPEPKTPSTP